MSGYWWLKAKTYLRDALAPKWLNQDVCVPAAVAGRYAATLTDTYVGEDRALPLEARPHFDLPHRERRVLDLRCIGPSYRDDLDPFFLISRELADVVKSVDPECLHLAECDISSHGRAPHGVCYLADAKLCVDGWDAFDRSRSDIDLKPSFWHDTGVPTRLVSVHGVVYFKPESVGTSAVIRVRMGPRQSRVCISNALADAIFAQDFLGLELVDASSDRRAPERYAQYKTPGWGDAYPA